MKSKIYTAILLALLTATVTSCLDDKEDEMVYYDDTAITSFALGNLKREVHTKSSTGEDSTYWTTVDCSSYKFSINQTTGEISNQDSLPTGIYLKKALCTVSSKNSGTIIINLKKEESTVDSLYYFTSTDSLDLSVPRELRVYNSKQTAFRSYTLKINTHKEEADSFRWTNVANYADLVGTTDMKTVKVGNFLLTLGNSTAGTRMFVMNTTTKEWSSKNTSLDNNAWKNLVATNDKAYTLSGGYIQTCEPANLSGWQQSYPANSIEQLIGLSGSALYALNNDHKLVVSENDGETWSVVKLDNSNDLLPQTETHLLCLPLSTNTNTNTLVLVGNNSENSKGATVWGAVDEPSVSHAAKEWFLYDVTDDNLHLLPIMNHVQAIAYDGSILVFGNTKTGNVSISPVYQSKDRGLTWWANSTFSLPAAFAPVTNAYAMTVDEENCIWLISADTGMVWRGRLNRLGWK